MAVSTVNAELFDPAAQQRALGICLAVSILLHAAVLVTFPGLRAGKPSEPGVKMLTAKLAPATLAPAPTPPVAQAVPQAPEPPLPPPEVKPAPPQPFLTRPASKASKAEAVPVAPPAPSAPAPSAPAPAEPAAAPAPQAPSAGEPGPRQSESFDAGSVDQYKQALIEEAKRFKRYPAQAMQNGWTGKAEIRLVVRTSGMILSASVKTSTGYAILDNQALDMIRKAWQRAPIPPALRGREFTVDIPVIFDLQNG